MPDHKSKALIESSFAFWHQLNKKEQDLLLNNASMVHYKQGENIHSGENDCVGVLLLKEGSLRVYLLSEDGREITLYRLGKGEVCILSASCILKEITFDVLVDAESDCDIILIKSSAFEEVCRNNIFAENYSNKLAVERFSDVMWAMQQILFMSFDKRLAIFLLDEASRTGSDKILLTHEKIARYVGSAREVVSRMLKYFENEKYIELFRGGLKIIDKNKLRNLL